jgi:hypothetical protein
MKRVLVISDSLITFNIVEKMLQGQYEVSLVQEYNKEKVEQNDIILIEDHLFNENMLPSDKKFVVIFTNTSDKVSYVIQNGGSYLVKPFLKERLIERL